MLWAATGRQVFVGMEARARVRWFEKHNSFQLVRWSIQFL
jgi:hypothetical protein